MRSGQSSRRFGGGVAGGRGLQTSQSLDRFEKRFPKKYSSGSYANNLPLADLPSGGGAGLVSGGALRVSLSDMAAARAVHPLAPYPTITKNRTLHAAKLPLVPRSDGFLDPFRARDVQGRFAVAAGRALDEKNPGRVLLGGADKDEIDHAIRRGIGALQRRGVSYVMRPPATTTPTYY